MVRFADAAPEWSLLDSRLCAKVLPTLSSSLMMHACAGPDYCNEYPFEPICKPGWKHAVATLWQRAMGYMILFLATLACSPGLALYLYRRKRRRAFKGGTDDKGSL